MANPILVNLTRGDLVESFHRGALCVSGTDSLAASLGDTDRPVFPRSAIKILQALPMVESGAADAAGFTAKELALACASHSGEPFHVDLVKEMLQKTGHTVDDLACGPQWPLGDEAAHDLAASGSRQTRLHNNCSGKHAGMLAMARYIGAPSKGYERPDHPVQKRIRETIEAMTCETATAERCGIDGCSVPTWAVPLKGFARAFARLATFKDLGKERADATRRLMNACTSEPLMVEGTGCFGTGVMQRLGARAFVKGGAEGVYCAAFPDQGLGLALKIDDGAKRGAEAAAAFIIAGLFKDEVAGASELFDMRVTNWRGTEVGKIWPSGDLKGAIERLSG